MTTFSKLHAFNNPFTTGEKVQHRGDDLFFEAKEEHQIDFENEGGETYLCGNPPYVGYNRQTSSHKDDMDFVFKGRIKKYGIFDYVLCWFFKTALYIEQEKSKAALVSTNTICQGSQVPTFWPNIFSKSLEIFFAHSSFKWKNLASKNAGVTVIIVGLQQQTNKPCNIYWENNGESHKKTVKCIGPYLIPDSKTIVYSRRDTLSEVPDLTLGNHPYYGAELVFNRGDKELLLKSSPHASKFIRPFLGATEIIKGVPRFCLWIKDREFDEAYKIENLKERIDKTKRARIDKKEKDKTAENLINFPYRFRDQVESSSLLIAVPQVSSEKREYLPASVVHYSSIISFQAYGFFDQPLWVLAIIVSKLHWNWISKICRRHEMRYSYSNTLGWNTFPLPTLTQKNVKDLTESAEEILLTRESHFPATIANLYDPEKMPENLREAHDRNDEILERIYIGRKFKNDTERLESLFKLYEKMTETPQKLEFNS